jgi:signal transduction histidine kinase/phage-related protein
MSRAFVKKMQDGPNEFFKRGLKGKQVQDWYAFQKTTNQFADKYLDKASSLNYYWYSLGPVALGISTYEPLNNEEQELLVRFRNVFELSYRRFIDIEKAEAQAREAQIELALERVRAGAMAMRKSSELGSLIFKVYKELTKLDARLDRCFIMIVNPDNLGITWWLAGKEGLLAENGFFIQKNEHPSHLLYLDCWKKRKKKWVYLFEGIEKRNWDRFGFKETELAKLPEPVKQDMAAVKKVYLSGSSDSFGSIVTGSLAPLSNEHQELISRFSIVFNQTYTRFLDLQKAEEQTREAQIQLALERVRARTMAMHKSDELKEVISLVLSEIRKLDILAEHAGFYIDYKMHDDMHIWLADPNLEPFFTILPYFDTPTWNSFLEAKAKGTILHTDLLDFKAKNKFYKSLFKLFTIPEEAKQFYMQCKGLAVSTVLLDSVGLYIENFSAIPYADDENEILIRFGKVFQQTYTRFLDLQKAEAQAREAQIEAALERVRAKAMAMHSTNELKEVVHELRRQMGLLGQKKLETCVIHLHDESEHFIQSWAGISPPDSNREILETVANVPKKGLLIIEEALRAYTAKREEYVILNEGRKLKQWFSFLEKESPESYNTLLESAKGNIEELKAFWSFADFAGGSLIMVTLDEPDEPTRILLRRFANVFGLAYRRFADLKQAEAQAREAKIEAALEKVRARAMAMQKADELIDVAMVLRKEMGLLGVEELETSSIYILNEATQQTECWYAIKDENKLVADHMVIDLNETWVGRQMLAFYGSDAMQASIAMQGDNRKEWIHYCSAKSKALTGFYGDTIPDRTYHLYKFSHGYMGAASPGEISAESRDLLKRATIVFSLAYTRFNDLKIAEAHALQAEQDLMAIKEAKQKAEEALTELQATQRQLIQSEKMASLGELTAGIAHEIQNPLNFVNNFSEVSGELIKEMVDEVDKGNTDEVKAIAGDLIGNLEKINHHGKRAADIVKGMLQHSRTSSGQKELTDINALCDEYLRLAYHGLRAKDKSFNAKFETSFDETVVKLNVVPQEIGRVVLNLINNAFYAASLNPSRGGTLEPDNTITPTVWVSTKKEENKVLISVRDNGPGIPDAIKEKIFQPFFTTKPTGQGTGLGLSLSYDIVTKGHGGELKVETKEGEGTTFIIQLPN